MNTTVPARPTERRLNGRHLGLVAIVLMLFAVSACMNDQQFQAYDLVNRERTTRGGHLLLHDATAQAKAQNWAEHMAATGVLAHSNLRDGMDSGWTKLGENVGRGGSIEAIHRAFMNSSGHRNNILDPAFTHLGVGVAKGSAGVFVVHVFTRR